MIISASRRTDIPAFYSDWFFNRIKDTYVHVRNPFNNSQIKNISLKPEEVECIVFWSKNPGPMLKRLKELNDHVYYFQYSLNPYDNDIEVNLPPKNKLIEIFKTLSEVTDPKKVIWRYDPVLLNNKYTVNYHLDNFSSMASELKTYTKKVTISFIDFYKKIEKNLEEHNITEITEEDKDILAKGFSKAAEENALFIESCAENIDHVRYKIKQGSCIDPVLISELAKKDLKFLKDKNQRAACGCVSSQDIGEYNTCLNNCIYCYANYSKNTAIINSKKHDPLSSILKGSIMD